MIYLKNADHEAGKKKGGRGAGLELVLEAKLVLMLNTVTGFIMYPRNFFASLIPSS